MRCLEGAQLGAELEGLCRSRGGNVNGHIHLQLPGRCDGAEGADEIPANLPTNLGSQLQPQHSGH